jgi:hypothetical protein
VTLKGSLRVKFEILRFLYVSDNSKTFLSRVSNYPLTSHMGHLRGGVGVIWDFVVKSLFGLFYHFFWFLAFSTKSLGSWGMWDFMSKQNRNGNACSPTTGAPGGVRNGGRPRRRHGRRLECSAPKGAEGVGRKHQVDLYNMYIFSYSCKPPHHVTTMKYIYYYYCYDCTIYVLLLFQSFTWSQIENVRGKWNERVSIRTKANVQGERLRFPLRF